MPDIENILETQAYSQHWTSQFFTEYHQPLGGWQQGEELNCSLEVSRELHHLTFLDCLTQIAKRRCFDAYLEQEWQRMAQEQAPLSVILCALDFFNVYNDTYGHQASDRGLQKVARMILKAARHPANLVARYSFEKFIVILPQTKAEGAVRVAEEIRRGVKALQIPINPPACQYLTMSVGVANIIPNQDYSSTMLITAAEQALYQAREQ
ncbi:MAG: GGDEF domain-containing protein, partial [Microcoleus sp. SIO2G3]|nr:GGDEF domain-containing protein [Microcoleus sp. SIO2G3]